MTLTHSLPKNAREHKSDNGYWQDAEELRWAVRSWATKMDVAVRQIQIRSMTTKWASISTAGRLTLNNDVLSLPRDLGEYIIVHELGHLLMPNHAKVWKLFLDAYLPDWRERQRRLRELETEE